MSDVLRQHAEQQFAHELDALKAVNDRSKPTRLMVVPSLNLRHTLTITDGHWG